MFYCDMWSHCLRIPVAGFKAAVAVGLGNCIPNGKS